MNPCGGFDFLCSTAAEARDYFTVDDKPYDRAIVNRNERCSLGEAGVILVTRLD